MIYRLKKQSDFDKIFKKGKKVYAKSLMMLYFESETFRIGYSVSKKHGKAVKRNRIKRLLRASAREVFRDFSKNIHVVFLPKVQQHYSFEEYVKDMSFVLKKENLK